MCLDDCDFPLPAVGERRRGGHSEKRRVKRGGAGVEKGEQQ